MFDMRNEPRCKAHGVSAEKLGWVVWPNTVKKCSYIVHIYKIFNVWAENKTKRRFSTRTFQTWSESLRFDPGNFAEVWYRSFRTLFSWDGWQIMSNLWSSTLSHTFSYGCPSIPILVFMCSEMLINLENLFLNIRLRKFENHHEHSVYMH